jgi:AcrR family transcriptional regulator
MDDKLVFVDQRPTRSDAVRNRELLLETARRLFAEQGVDAVTMSDLAEAAGVGKGTLYRHFANKVDLCHELLDQDQRDLQNRTFARLRENGSPCADIEWFLREVIAFVMRNQSLVFAESAISGALAHPAHLWWRQTIRGLLMRLNPNIDVDYLADVLYVMLDPRTIYYQVATRNWGLDQIANSLIGVLRQLTA